MKNRRDRAASSLDVGAPRSRLLDAQGTQPAQDPEFMRAFADALRDILRDEHAHVAG